MAVFDMNPYVQRWVAKQARNAAWAVPGFMSYEDLIQEGWVKWIYVNNKYREKVTDAPHMTSLFMTAYTRHLNSLRKRRTLQEVSIEDNKAAVELITVPPTLAQLTYDAPEPIASIIRLLSDPNECILSPPFSWLPDGTRDTSNKKLKRRLADYGIETSGNLFKQVRNHFKRERLYEKAHEPPTIVECVGIIVDNYLASRSSTRTRERLEQGASCTKSHAKLNSTPVTASQITRANAAISTGIGTRSNARLRERL